jgi:hypothetical protein
MGKLDFNSLADINYGFGMSENYKNENTSIGLLFKEYSKKQYNANKKNKAFVFKVLYTLKNNNKIEEYVLNIFKNDSLSKSYFGINFNAYPEITIQLQRYIDWIEQYYLPNRPSDIKPIIISRGIKDKKSQNFQNLISKLRTFNNNNNILPLRYIEFFIECKEKK